MILSVLFPESYDAAREIVETWSWKTPYRGITYTEREISTLTVMNTNLSAVPHSDPGLLLGMYEGGLNRMSQSQMEH